MHKVEPCFKEIELNSHFDPNQNYGEKVTLVYKELLLPGGGGGMVQIFFCHLRFFFLYSIQNYFQKIFSQRQRLMHMVFKKGPTF